MVKILLIMLGGGIGALLRYIISGWGSKIGNSLFPVGTLIVNVIGCLLIGFIWGMINWRIEISPELKIFIFIGFLGAFTTFSSYSLETYNLFYEGEIKFAILNIVYNNLFGVAAVILGSMLWRIIVKVFR